MVPEIISEVKFKKRFFKWLLDNKKGFYLSPYESVDEYAEVYPLPDFDYVHTQSMADENGDLTTLLRCNYQLRDWQTKNGRKHMNFNFYCILKTYLDRVEDGPVVYGYSIIE